jgi:hypothetical protein
VLAAERGIAFEILAHLGGTVMDFIGRTIDVFGSLPDIVADSCKLGLAHPVGPHDPGAKPLRMVDQDMKRRPLDGNARSLEPDTQLSENIVNEALKRLVKSERLNFSSGTGVQMTAVERHRRPVL